MFLHRPAKNGPNRPEVFPGKQRDRIRAEKRAEKGKERERVEGEQQDQQIQVLSENRDQSIVEEAGDGEADNDDGDEGMVVDGDEERPVNRSVAGEEMVIDPALMDIDNINPNSVDPVVEMDQHLDQAYRMDQMDQIDHSFAPQASASPRPTPAPTAITSRVDHSMLVSVPVPVPVSTHQPTQGQAGSESRPIPSSSPSTPSGLTTPNHIPNPYPYPDPMFDSGPADNADIFTSTPGPGPSTPYPTSGAGSSTGTGAGDGDGMEVGLPSLDTQQDPGSDMFATGPRSLGRQYKGGRPRTRPLLEIHRADQLVSTNINYLPDNVRSESHVTSHLTPHFQSHFRTRDLPDPPFARMGRVKDCMADLITPNSPRLTPSPWSRTYPITKLGRGSIRTPIPRIYENSIQTLVKWYPQFRFGK